MLTDRIIGALTFRRGVYAEVEHDKSFTQTAWLLVLVIAFLNQLGATAGVAANANFIRWIIAAVVSTAFAVLGFAVGAFVVSWVGKTLFSADINFEEAVRTLGLAYIWNGIGVLGIFSAITPLLTCLLTPVTFIAWILGLVAWLFAIKEALDLDWTQTIITLIIGWFVNFIITALAGIVLGIFGFAAAGLGSLLGR